ncbi:MAG: hypothetical protein RL768_2601 [Nitrospirota bacterium]|jgi:adenylate cyclase
MAWHWVGKQQLIHRLGFGLSALITGLMLALVWIGPEPLARLDNAVLDWLFWARGPRAAGSDVVLVGVDERSLKEVGRWPWPRNIQAQLLDTIAAGQPTVIGIDILYSEPEEADAAAQAAWLASLSEAVPESDTAGRQALQRLRDRLVSATGQGSFRDRRFAESLAQAGNVVLAVSLSVPVGQGVQPIPSAPIPDELRDFKFILVRRSASGEALSPYRASDALLPLPQFLSEVASVGQVYSVPDADGVSRFVPLALQYGEADEYYPSLALELARLHLGLSRDRMALALGQGVALDGRIIPTDQKLRLLLNHLGPEGTVTMVSATDVLHHRLPPELFRGKAVLFGTAALGAYDQKATPFSANVPGIELNATVLDNILRGQFIGRSLWAGPAELVLVTLFGLGAGAVLPRLRAAGAAAVAGGALAAWVTVVYRSFAFGGQWINALAPAATILLCYVAITVLRFLTEEREKEEIRKIFTPYVGPQIVNDLMNNPAKASQRTRERRELTMLFCDLVGFTRFCEQHGIDHVVQQVNEYLEAMTEVVFRWNGTLIDFKGDEVYALWGAPMDQPDHAELALKCAFHMRKRLAELNEQWKEQGKPVFEHGIGLNTGTVLVANMGATGKRMKFAAVGDAVNLASRVEGFTRKFGVPILLTEYTVAHLQPIIDGSSGTRRFGHVLLRQLARVKAKGKEEPVIVYEARSLAHDEPSRIDIPDQLELIAMTEK